MKRLLYYTSRDMTSPDQGINKKIWEQIEALRGFGFQVDAIYRKHDADLVLHDGKGERILKKGMSRPYKIGASRYTAAHVRKAAYDGVYIRYVYGDRQFFRLLKLFRAKGMSVVLEIPTYPYDTELIDTLENRIVLFLDKRYRNRMRPYVDRVVTFSRDSEIFGIPTIRTMNGIDFAKIPLVSDDRTYSDKVNIIAVADLAKWHGYDRLLEGMGVYYHNGGQRDLLFHLVGSGTELDSYKAIVEKWGIQEHVIFYGRKYGRELDEVYNYCSLAAACFGFHRIGLKLASNIKSREYVAKGMPVLASVDIDVFQGVNMPYFLKVSYDDTPVDMEQVLAFHDRIYAGKDKETVASEIRNFAKDICDIRVVMKPVADYLMGN